MFCFISLDAMMKYLLASYSLVQVTWARFFFATVIALLASAHNFRAIIHTRRSGSRRSARSSSMLTTGVFNAGIRTVPLATATTIMFFSPILVTVLSIPLLKEHVGLRRWIGVGGGLCSARSSWCSRVGRSGMRGALLLAHRSAPQCQLPDHHPQGTRV